jgi:hypothetical protein
VVAKSFSSHLALSRVASESAIPMPRSSYVLAFSCVYQVFLCSDEDGAVQRDPPYIFCSLDDGLPLSIVGDHINIDYLIHRFGNLLITPCECISQIYGGVYLFEVRFLNFLIVL